VGINVQKRATIQKNTVITSALFSFLNSCHADIPPLFSVISNLKSINALKAASEKSRHVAMHVRQYAGWNVLQRDARRLLRRPALFAAMSSRKNVEKEKSLKSHANSCAFLE